LVPDIVAIDTASAAKTNTKTIDKMSAAPRRLRLRLRSLGMIPPLGNAPSLDLAALQGFTLIIENKAQASKARPEENIPVVVIICDETAWDADRLVLAK
jgi:hypothetical protein